MNTCLPELNEFQSKLSFVPLFRTWERIVSDGRPGMKIVYQQLLDKVKKFPELLVPIEDERILEKHQLLIEEMMTTIFPATVSDENDLFAISIPFQYKTIYASKLFSKAFMADGGSVIQMPDKHTEQTLNDEKALSAYQMLLARFYDVKVEGVARSVHPYKCPITGLDKYMELELDVRFIDIKTIGELPILPEQCCKDGININNPETVKIVASNIPLSHFSFEGFVIVKVRDVTDREIIGAIKNSLLTMTSFDDPKLFTSLQKQVQDLISVPDISITIKPFFQVNNHLVVSKPYTTNAAFLNDVPSAEKHQFLFNRMSTVFGKGKKPIVVTEITDDQIKEFEFFGHFRKKGFNSVIIYPLFDGIRLIGMLGIMSEKNGALTIDHVAKVEPVVSLFELAVRKTQELLDNQVDKVIKDKFTAVQPAVEWRFTEAALSYLTKKEKGKETAIEPIVFNNVFPLYGAIDIRNSSVERNKAIQQDLLEQLHLVDEIVRQAQKQTSFPILDEIRYKLDKYSDSTAASLFSDEETNIQLFLKNDIIQLFKHLQTIVPSLDGEIKRYFEAVDTPVQMFYSHRKDYEASITRINEEIACFLDGEQEAAQKIFPHYFERFVTDGVDFNIYVGQSITPGKAFDPFYLKNLKIWQLTTLSKAAQLSSKLERSLSLSLKTTQLILAHSHPISISFRTAERKFDVDGAYNIRYEIIKKRIDKVHIKNSTERLTQPGTIAIVYSQAQEGHEYMEYIDYLRNKKLLKGPVQQLELEELQGVSGLKGLRVEVNLEEIENSVNEFFSRITMSTAE